MTMKKVAIVGVGMHKFGRFEDKTYRQIGQEAVKKALEDANISWSDIQTAYMSTQYLPPTAGVRILKPLGATGIPLVDVEAACASGGVAIKQAMQAIQAGSCDLAMAVGTEKMPRGFMDPMANFEKWQVEMGMSTNPSYWSIMAHRHMHDYGTTELQIAKVAYKNHKNSVNNPYAMYQKEFTIEEILASPLVCDPIHLLEICAPNEGAAAVVLSSWDTAHKYTATPLAIEACVHTIAQYSSDFRVPIESMSAKVVNPSPTETASRKAYEQAGIGPEDLDVVELQDTDAFCELEAYEKLGLCGPGESGRLIDEGVTAMGGRLPVNVSGGLISKGEPVGASHLGQIAELVWQLRGQAGKRQVPGAKVAMGHVLGAGGNCAVTILKR
jgi:acetyl-CoA C-acetyltransferase